MGQPDSRFRMNLPSRQASGIGLPLFAETPTTWLDRSRCCQLHAASSGGHTTNVHILRKADVECFLSSSSLRGRKLYLTQKRTSGRTTRLNPITYPVDTVGRGSHTIPTTRHALPAQLKSPVSLKRLGQKRIPLLHHASISFVSHNHRDVGRRLTPR